MVSQNLMNREVLIRTKNAGKICKSPCGDLSLSPMMRGDTNKTGEQKLIQAVDEMIRDEGFSNLGVNRIARAAGCDKVLIYRYFGGLDGLIVAWAQRNDFYVQAYDALLEELRDVKCGELKEATRRVLLAQLRFTRENPTLQALLRWELSGHRRFGVVRELREAQGLKLQRLLDEKLGSEKHATAMYIVILVASINYTILSTSNYPMFNGIDFSDEQSWKHYEEALCNYVDFIFDGGRQPDSDR